MKRTFLIPFISALVGGAVVVAVVAAFGGLSNSSKTVTTVQAAPIAPSNASQKPASGLTPHDIYVRDAPGVAFVTSTVVQKSESSLNLFGGGEEAERQGEDTGSGIVIDANGTILTNYHVVENAIKVTVSFEKGKSVEAKVVGKDPSNDLAVLRISTDGLTLHPLTLGDSSTVEVGDPVLAIGNPFDLERTLTTGVISALQRQITAPNGFTIDNVLQTDAPINPGNSGGPLLNEAGEVIGINSQIETGGSGDDGSVGIGFSIPINTAKSEIADARERRHDPRRLPRSDLADDRRLAVGAEPAGQGRRARGERAEGHRRRKGRDQRRQHQRHRRRRPGRGRRRHHRLDRRQARRELGRPRERHRGGETGRHGQHRAGARERARAATNTRR